ncbi:MAG: helix-turn-helix domain-containing protein [Longimicrobiales bacterium]
MPETRVVFYKDEHGAEKGNELRRRQIMSRRRPTSEALEILDRMIGDDPELRALIQEERVNAEVAVEIYQLRTSRGLTQDELAKRVGTAQSVIARLEDADYDGHSLRMLRRIAEALGARLRVHFVPIESLL